MNNCNICECDNHAYEQWKEAKCAFHQWETGHDLVHHCDDTPTVIFKTETHDEYFCNGFDKMKTTITDFYSGYTEDDLHLYNSTTQESLVEHDSVDCGYIPPTPEPIYDVITEITYFCDGVDKMKQIHTDYLSGYSETTMEIYDSVTNVELFEHNSSECGYIPPTPPTPTDCDTKVYYKDGTVETLSGATRIEPEAYYENGNVVKVVFGDCLEEIGVDAFHYCSALTTVELSNSITTIGIDALCHCAYSKLIIPSSVTELKSEAFGFNPSLTEVRIMNPNVKFQSSMTNTPFLGSNKITDMYFNGTKEQFKNTLPIGTKLVYLSELLNKYPFTLHLTDGDINSRDIYVEIINERKLH